jgi:hypothetical protein
MASRRTCSRISALTGQLHRMARSDKRNPPTVPSARGPQYDIGLPPCRMYVTLFEYPSAALRFLF